MTNNELFTQCNKLIASINFFELTNQRLMEAISNGDLKQANENGTSHTLPQLIVYNTLARFAEQLRKSIPRQLTELEKMHPVL
jgi:hypothetical protein